MYIQTWITDVETIKRQSMAVYRCMTTGQSPWPRAWLWPGLYAGSDCDDSAHAATVALCNIYVNYHNSTLQPVPESQWFLTVCDEWWQYHPTTVANHNNTAPPPPQNPRFMPNSHVNVIWIYLTTRYQSKMQTGRMTPINSCWLQNLTVQHF